MDHTEKSRQEEFVHSIEEMLTAASNPGAGKQFCSRCGQVKEPVEALFWLYGTNAEWNVQLHMCACDLGSRETNPKIQSHQDSAGTAETMNCENGKSWRELYKEAVFEKDRKQLLARIDAAEASLLLRARELFRADANNIRERQEVDAALFALYALKSAAMSAGTKKEAGISDHNQKQAA